MRRFVLLLVAILLVLPSLATAQKRQAFIDPVDLRQLRTECTTNPNGYSYTDTTSGTTLTLAQWYAAGADNIVAEILNTTRAGIAIYRSDVSPNEVKEAITIGQLTSSATASIAALQGAWLNAFFGGEPVRLKTKAGADARVLTSLLAVLTNGSSSETRVRALAERRGTRAEQLWGCATSNDPGCENVVVQPFHVAQARSLP